MTTILTISLGYFSILGNIYLITYGTIWKNEC